MKKFLKNKVEREAFLDSYKHWGVFAEIPELKLKFYKYRFPSGDKFIVTEYFMPAGPYVKARWEKKFGLITTQNSPYKGGYGQYYTDAFDPAGCSKGTLIDYLTKVRPEVEVVEDADNE